MQPVIRRVRAAAVVGLVGAAFWTAFFLLYLFGFAAMQAHPARILLHSLPELLLSIVAVSVVLGLIFAGGLYLWRPKTERGGLSGRRAGLIGALSTSVGYLALQATVFGGLSTSAWIAPLVSAGALGVVGAVAGIALQRMAYRRSLITGSPEHRAITP